MRLTVTLALMFFLGSTRVAQAQILEQPELPESGIQLGEPVVQRWQIGAIVQAPSGPVRNLLITLPIPSDWPEQTVKVTDEDFSDNIANVGYRVVGGNLKQMVVLVGAVPPGGEARAVLTFEITTYQVRPPADTSQFELPRNPPRDVRPYLGISPYINSRQRSIRRQVDELIDDEQSAWEQIEALYDWTRDNIQITNERMKGANETLDAGQGCGEDAVNVFVALCRAHRVPARIVWVQNHYYAEFYLDDAEGNGHWFPCQVVGNREFGGMSEVKPILQRGDNIRVPEKKDPYRFVPELVKGAAGGGRPHVKFVRELLPAQ